MAVKIWCFNDQKKKKELNGRILDWTQLSSYNGSITFTHSSSSYGTDYLDGSGWSSMCTNWKNYDVIRVRFEVSSLTYTKSSSGTAEANIVMGNDVVLETGIASGSTYSYGLTQEALFIYYLRGRFIDNAGGTNKASFWPPSGNEVDPATSLRPYLYSRYVTNGSFNYKLIIEGANLYT